MGWVACRCGASGHGVRVQWAVEVQCTHGAWTKRQGSGDYYCCLLTWSLVLGLCLSISCGCPLLLWPLPRQLWCCSDPGPPHTLVFKIPDMQLHPKVFWAGEATV